MERARRHATEEGAYPSEPVVMWWRRHVRLIEALVVGGVFVYNFLYLVTFIQSAGWPVFVGLLAASVILSAAFLLRRQRPLIAFAVMLMAAFAQLLLNAGVIFVDVLLVFLVFSIASRFRWTVSVPATAVVLVWLGFASAQLFDEGYVGPGDVMQLLTYLLLVWLAGTLTRVHRAYVESLRERARELERQRDAQAQIAAAAERSRIAREIHDVVSHSLSVVVLMTDGAISKVRTDPERAEQVLVTARDTGRAAMTEMRRMVGVLRTSETALLGPQPGTGQLEMLAEESRAAGLPVKLHVSGEPVALSESLDLCVYRVVQEGLTNARKHGGPTVTSVDVHLTYGDDELSIEITDDGKGPDLWREAGPGHGLAGMRERVALYGGDLRTGTRPGGGFALTVTLPTNEGTT
ncbi:sensor histidine kinase [Brachybacterium alimentarium]|uniref:sensor histidine kinase n=1 Tax=Brachybacterium alimentarium TaxID=47845 RepID=UPI003FD695F4